MHIFTFPIEKFFLDTLVSLFQSSVKLTFFYLISSLLEKLLLSQQMNDYLIDCEQVKWTDGQQGNAKHIQI